MFDYTAIDTPDEVIRSVAAEISGGGLKPLPDDERLARAAWRKEQALLAKKLSAERERRQQEAEAIARQEAAAERVEANRKVRLEQQKRDLERQRDQQIVGLHIRQQQHDVWQSHVEQAARNALAVRQQQALLVDVERFLTLPTPPPEPEPIAADDDLGSPNIGDENFNPRYWLRKPIFR